MSANYMHRRDVLKLGAAATVAAATVGVGGAAVAAQATPTFLTTSELALLDELSEMIIPTDGHSPGARAAKVAAYIDMQLGEAFETDDRALWRDGLKRVNDLSHSMTGAPFMQASAERRVAVLTKMAENETKATTPEEKFFVELKSRVVDAYYSSEIGIKQEMEYKGNSYLTEFVGTDVSKP